MRDPHRDDMAQRGHVAAPPEPTWTHLDTYVARKLQTQAKLIGPTGIVGLREEGGRTRASRQRKAIRAHALI